MLGLIVSINHFKAAIPGTILAAASVPYFIGSVGWYAISRILPGRLYSIVDDFMYGGYQRCMLFAFENMSGITVNLYGDVDDVRIRNSHESIIYISNHQSTMDWAVANMLAVREGCLGHLRYVLKHSLQYLPLYGYYFWMHGCVYVRRAGQFQKDKSGKHFDYIAQLEQPTWLVIFPEGTRYNPDKKRIIEESQRHATAIGVQPLEYVLMPRSRGLEMALSHLRHRLDAVYDVTIAYDQSVDRKHRTVKKGPSMFDFVSSEPETAIHVHVKRIPIKEVPLDSEGLRKWLYERFKEKDELLKGYYQKKLSAISAANDDAFPDLKYRDSCLPLSSTLPSFLIICVGGLLPFLMMRNGGKAFVGVLVLGTAFGIGCMKMKKAA